MIIEKMMLDWASIARVDATVMNALEWTTLTQVSGQVHEQKAWQPLSYLFLYSDVHGDTKPTIEAEGDRRDEEAGITALRNQNIPCHGEMTLLKCRWSSLFCC